MNNKGFTLAEVLITLGIIGVVAALTMPSLITNYQKKQIVTQLKKAYSTFSQALVLSQYENGNSSEWDVTEAGSSYEENLAYFEKYWKPYLKVLKVCKTMQECGYKYGGYAMLNDKQKFSYYGAYNNQIPGFIYGDGTYAYIRPYGFNNIKLQLLSIDLNGAKAPNIIGKDVFQFSINTTKGTITGFSAGDYTSCTVENIQNYNEASRNCASKIIHDGWEIKSDYPW